MQPNTNIKLDKESFERMKKTIKNMSVCSRGVDQNPGYAAPLPEEVGIQLTNRCNLRCKHCFEWNNEGYNWDMDVNKREDELPLDIVSSILEQTRSTKANLFLWGGEPLFYKEWDRLSYLLEQEKRWSVLCTNGLLVEEKMDSLLKISDSLAILTSIEGFEHENDLIRGKGSYKRAIEGIKEVIALQRKGKFKGKQSVHCTISDNMIGKLYSFMEYFEDLGVDTVYFCFPWYIPKEVSEKMDNYFEENFGWLFDYRITHRRSWHSFKFRLNPDHITILLEELEKINKRVWKIRIRYQPAVEMHEVRDFILGKDYAVQNRKRCLAVTNRMDVLSDGKVSACKIFSEFRVGDLNTMSVAEIWTGEKFRRVREIISKGLTPVCSKCILLYLNGK